jgi:hypothetical protein
MLKIEIQTNADFTPAGKRTARIVKTAKSGRKCQKQMRWYVAGEVFRTFANVSHENVALTKEWLVV